MTVWAKAPREPRFDEVTVHTPTIAATAKRARITEAALYRTTTISRKTVRSCLGLTNETIVNIKEGSFKLLMKAFRDRLSENIAEEPFLCRLRGGAGDDALREVDHFQTEVAREILGLRSEFSLIAALARDANAVMFVQDEEQALDLYAALINNLWERRNPHAHWMCSWREASRYIAYLRCEQSDLKYYGDPDRKAGCVTEEVQKLIGDLGWHDISPARYSQAELAALAPLLEHSRKEARSEFRKQTAKKRPDRPKVSED